MLEAPPVAIDLLIGIGLESHEASPAIRNRHARRSRRRDAKPKSTWLAERVQYELWQGGAQRASVA